MNNDKEQFSFTQRSFFPWIKKEIEVDLKENQARIKFGTLCKQQEMTLRLDEIDENAELFSHRAYGWLGLLLLSGIGLFVYLVGSFFDISLITKIWPAGVVLLISTSVSLYFYHSRTSDILLYVNLSRQGSFNFLLNRPSKATYEAFITRFNSAILYARKRRELDAIIQGISTDFLKEEFSLFYIEELLRRGVDINQLLDSTKKIFLASYISEQLVGRTVN